MYIDDLQSLKKFCDNLGSPEYIAVDTEFIREKTYYPVLEIIQIATPNMSAVIDYQKLGELGALGDLLLDKNVLKVFHAGRQDVEIFYNILGEVPVPIFDTQVAASFAGHGLQVGYARLVEDLMSKSLDKQETLTDWSIRPLSKSQIQYALDDVLYLHPVYTKLREQLRKSGRLDWALEECTLLENPDYYKIAPDDEIYKRVKGQGPLKPRQRALLRELAGWREKECREHDVPRNKVVRDDVLLEISRMAPKDVSGLKKLRYLNPGILKKYGNIFIECVARGLAVPSQELPQKSKAKIKTPTGVVELLQVVLRGRADQLGIAPSMIASSDDLSDLVRQWCSNGSLSNTDDIFVLRGWRGNLVGKDLADLLEGNSSVMINTNKKQVTVRKS